MKSKTISWSNSEWLKTLACYYKSLLRPGCSAQHQTADRQPAGQLTVALKQLKNKHKFIQWTNQTFFVRPIKQWTIISFCAIIIFSLLIFSHFSFSFLFFFSTFVMIFSVELHFICLYYLNCLSLCQMFHIRGPLDKPIWLIYGLLLHIFFPKVIVFDFQIIMYHLYSLVLYYYVIVFVVRD